MPSALTVFVFCALSHCLALGVTFSPSPWAAPTSSLPWAPSSSPSATPNSSRRSRRRGIASFLCSRSLRAGDNTRPSSTARSSSSIMNPDNGSLPNWRDVDPNGGGGDDSDVHCSPFCHPLSEQSHTATAAPWSQAAFDDALELYRRMETCTDPDMAPLLQSALEDMKMAYRLYGPYCMVGSYNGGKDAVVIFHLMRAVHAHHCYEMQKADAAFMIPRPRVIYFQHPDEFPEVLSLLDGTVGEYDLDMLAFKEGVSFGDGLKHLVERNYSPGKDGLSFHGNSRMSSGEKSPMPPPHALAFVLGTRKDDPNAGSQGVYAPSSSYMPPFMRVNPILNWTYGHVWHFLRSFELPYCSLYDDGYTSLGTVKDTMPCPALRKNDGSDGYWPAYMLRQWDMERAGRIGKKKKEDNAVLRSDAEDEKSEGDVDVIPQTSSTVSLARGEDGTRKLTVSISTTLNLDVGNAVMPATKQIHSYPQHLQPPCDSQID